MGEVDPFGREIGEDTLKGLRGGEAAPAAPVTRPAPSDGPVFTPPAPPQSPPPVAATTPTPPRQPPTSPRTDRPNVVVRRPSGFRAIRIVSAVFGLLVLLAVIGSVTHDVKSVTDKIHVPKFNFPKAPTIPSGGGKPAKPPTGLGRGSLVRPAGLRHAFALIGREHAGRVKVLRVAPARVDVTMVDSHGSLHQIQVAAGAKRATTISVTTGGFPQTNALPLRAFDAAAPARLVRAAARRAHVPASKLDYLAVAPTGDIPLTWSAFFTRGGQWIGDAHGRVKQRI